MSARAASLLVVAAALPSSLQRAATADRHAEPERVAHSAPAFTESFGVADSTESYSAAGDTKSDLAGPDADPEFTDAHPDVQPAAAGNADAKQQAHANGDANP